MILSLSVSKGEIKGRLLHVFLPQDGGEFALKPLNLMRSFARCLRFIFNLILMPLDQPALVGRRLFRLSHWRLLLIHFLHRKLSWQQPGVQD